MTASVGLGRNHALIAFLLDPDLGILEGFAIGATHNTLDGLAKCGPGKNNHSRYKNSGQYSCSIKHETILLEAKITYQYFLPISAWESPTPNPCGRSPLLRGGFQPRSRDAAKLKQSNQRFFDQVVRTGGAGGNANDDRTRRQPEVGNDFTLLMRVVMLNLSGRDQPRSI